MDYLGDSYNSLDYFGHTVNLNYKQRASHPTCAGATFSILIRTFLAYYVYDKVYRLITHGQDGVQSQAIGVDLSKVDPISISDTDALAFWILTSYPSGSAFYPADTVNTSADYRQFMSFEFMQQSTDYKASDPAAVNRYRVFGARQCKLKDFCFGVPDYLCPPE